MSKPTLEFHVLPKSQAALWNFFSSHSDVLGRCGFYLAGGTALALQIGHRQSVDFDFFSQKPALGSKVSQWLKSYPNVFLRDYDPNTVHAEFRKIKVSFIGAYEYPLVTRAVNADGLRLASIVDIGLMKLLAITHRAALRDYIDLAAIIRDHVSLPKLLELSPRKYGKKFNRMIPLKALVSYDDLDQEMPKLLDRTLAKKWQAILTQAVKQAS